ncbi:MAG: phage major capsid protein, partial [Gammaproteobacteria bacterium]|nr:phage major capsid protein [Gammaproteobacteria bacterium]
DVVDGILRNVSIGYINHEMMLESRDGEIETYRVIDWEPYEISVIAVPADPTVGVGRSLNTDSNPITIRGKIMTKETTPTPTPAAQGHTAPTGEQQRSLSAAQQAPAAQARQEDILANERSRIREINAIGEQFQQRGLVQDAIAKGNSVDQFRALVLERLTPTKTGQFDRPGGDALSQPQKNISARSLGIGDGELQRYSMMRAIEAARTGNWAKAGFEREVSLEIAKRTGKESRGFYMPHEILGRRQLEKKTPGKGGEMVATELMTDEFIKRVRDKAVIGQLGARILSGLVGDVDIPKQITGGNFYWIDEDEDVPESDFDFTTIGLKPKTIAGAIPVTRRLRKQFSTSVENMIRGDLIEGIGVASDTALINGTGQGNQPLGLLNMTGVPGLEYGNAGIDWDAVIDMETSVDTFNSNVGRLAYLTTKNERGSAKKTQVFDNTGERIWQDGEVNGYKAEASNLVPAGTWIYGDWSQILIGFWGVLDLKVDEYSKAASDGLILRVFQDIDINVRRKDAFCIAKKAAPPK